MRQRVDMFAALCLAGATISWGAAPVMLQYLTAYVPDGFTTNLVRYPVACLFYLPLLASAIRQGRGGRFWVAALLPAGVNLAGQTLWGIAPYHHLSAGTIAFLLRLSGVWGILGAFWLFPDERSLARRPLFWVGVSTAVGGFLIMSWAQVTQVSQAGWSGLLIMLACGVCYGFYGVTVRYVMGRLNPLFVFGVVGSYTSLGLIAMAPLGRPASLLTMPPQAWLTMLVSAVTGISLAHGMYYAAVQRIGAAVSTLMLSVTPFVTICGSAVFLGERFTPKQWVGGSILVLGATLAMRAQQHLPHPAPPTPSPDGSGAID
jgi:drug/metabolite transporter (DMT)-like permease